MANTFTKDDLRTGDIVVLRDRELGVVIAEKGVILFQNIGMGILDDYCDDLLYDMFFEEPENDIMEVVRGWFDSPVSFSDPYDGQLVFKRKDELGFIEKKDDSDQVYYGAYFVGMPLTDVNRIGIYDEFQKAEGK